MKSYEFTVKDTNMEALRAKKSAIECGYMKDAFINYFVPEHVQKEILMHRGYWCRFWCFNSLASHFLKNAKGKVQILSIGCGLDTLPYNLLKDIKNYSSADLHYFECDLKEVVEQKIDIITNHNDFVEFLKSKSSSEMVIHKGKVIRSTHKIDDLKLLPL